MGSGSIEVRLERVHRLVEAMAARRRELVAAAVEDNGFTRRECEMEVDTVVTRLEGFDEMVSTFAARRPICAPDQEVALVLPYNGSAWLNTAIVSIYLVGNRVRVKFASRGSETARFTESLYRPIFGDEIRFSYADGATFLQGAIADPRVPAICLFGSDHHAAQYLEPVRTHRKKFIFEGPGKDPFIVLAGADLEAAARELAFSKYLYAGQTCTAPERVYLQESIKEDFLRRFLELSSKVRVGDPADPETEMGPVASQRAVAAIKAQIQEAVARGARLALGGRIEGNLVYPTVVVEATQDMRGMQEESFGPVSFVASFATADEALALARDSRYGLRATVYGGQEEARQLGEQLVGEPYCHPVADFTFGRFGTVGINEPRSESWVGAFVSKAVGGYGYSGWIWETGDAGGEVIVKQGPKLLSLETSAED